MLSARGLGSSPLKGDVGGGGQRAAAGAAPSRPAAGVEAQASSHVGLTEVSQ